MINKKASHVGMILSFVIFITFLIYLFLILSPLIFTQNVQREFLPLISDEILNFLNVEVSRIFFTTTTAGNFFKINLDGTCFEDYFVLLKDYQENEIPSQKQVCDILFRGDSDKIHILYYSNFSLKEVDLESLPQGNFNDVNINYLDSNKYILDSRIFNLSSLYSEDYLGLKKDLNVPDLIDFGFTFNFENGTNISKGNPPLDLEVYSNELNVFYYNASFYQKKGVLRIFIW